MDLAIAIRIGSPQASLALVKTTIESLQENLGHCSWRFILSLDPKIPAQVKEYIFEKERKFPQNFELLPQETLYWAEFINKAIERAADCDYFIKAHDDIELLTPNFFPTVKKILQPLRERCAWISFDSVGYLRGHWTPPTRPGFFKDRYENNAWSKMKMFQFHTLPDNWFKAVWWKRWPYLLQQRVVRKIIPSFQYFKYPEVPMNKEYQALLDLPSAPVKCHAPWNQFVLIKMSVLKDLGPCENWQTYNALFVDEDWGLRALQKKYWNIWISSIKYIHQPPLVGGNRSQYMIKKDRTRVQALFREKWGFTTPVTRKKDLEPIREMYQNTYIPWSMDRYSYEWDYLK